MAINHSNNYSSTLSAAIAPGDTSITVNSDVGLPSAAGSDSFMLTLDDQAGGIEIIRVDSVAGTTLTVVRGQEGTTAASWAINSIIENRLTAFNIDDRLSFTFDFIDDDTMATAAADVVASAESIKSYVDNEILALNFLTEVNDDTSPEFSFNLDMNNKEIINVLRLRSDIISKASDTTNNITFTTSRITMKPFNSDVANFTTSGMQLGGANSRVNAIRDEDTMASNSNTSLATQQSIKAYIDNEIAALSPQLAKAWGTYDQTGTLTVLDSYNVSSVSDDGTGRATVTLSTPMANTNYSVVAMSEGDDAGFNNGITNYTPGATITTSSFSITTAHDYGTARDSDRVSFLVFGDQ